MGEKCSWCNQDLNLIRGVMIETGEIIRGCRFCNREDDEANSDMTLDLVVLGNRIAELNKELSTGGEYMTPKDKITVEKQEKIFTISDTANISISIEAYGIYDYGGYMEFQLKTGDTTSSLRFFTENIDDALDKLSSMVESTKSELSEITDEE